MDSEPTKALNLEIDQQNSFVRYYNSLPEKPASTIRFFSRSDYYTVHGDDASLVNEMLSLPIKFMGNQPQLSYICLNKSRFESILRDLLLLRQYRVEIFVKGPSKTANDWTLDYKASPGNLTQLEDLLFENAEVDFTNSVMAVKVLQNKLLAVGCVNITEAKFEVCEITDNDSFSELESIVAQIGPKECLVPAGESPESVSVRNLLERNGVLVAKAKPSDFSGEDVEQDLNRLLYFHEDQRRNASAHGEIDLKNAMGCLQALIKFLNLAGAEKNFNQFKLTTLDCHRFVRLDNAALYALNVLPKTATRCSNADNQQSLKTSSLKGLLDNCATAQGSRLLEQWIKQPLKDYNSINERLDIVEAILKDPATRSQLKDGLPRIVDMMPVARKLSSKKANLQDCYKVYQTVRSVGNIIGVLKNLNNKCVKVLLIEPLEELVGELRNYQSMIEHTLDFDLVDRGEFFIKSSFDDGLNELQKKKQKVESKMQAVLDKVSSDLDLEQGKGVKLDCNDQHGYFFRLTLKDEPTLRKRKEYKILDVVKSGVRFVNGALEHLNDTYRHLNEEYGERQKTVLEEVFEVAAGYVESLRNLNLTIATVDVLNSFAIAAISARIPYTKPKIHKRGSGILKLKQARHPCLEAQDNVSFIPNDVTFDKDDKLLYVITGPNMCGKSTYIRSVGICVLMAHIGCLVPCISAEISLVDGILVRVGADDCQLKGLSTFMLEMIETSTIIKSATENSLVIIDELGRGTSTYDGCGIAWAIAEHLVKEIKCFSLFATHFHEINELAELHSSVGNLHVSAVVADNIITPLYSIREGECDKSYGIHCARMVDFPQDVVQDAVEYQKHLEHQNGVKYLTGLNPSQKRKTIAEGDLIVREALTTLKSNLNGLSDEELINKVKELKKQLAHNDNLFVKGLLSD
ncbi:unnamed protein product [Phyllotreta striolata]|uniref:DNA mismatch repair proteins mutS family domain-containing protein n=1 Tax=Phyllotreta striolata TaxID=444603 RepID=A0A9N9XM99_PHYSR|nr:unnamed protein product [Phyllotreta striolata]